MLRLEGCVSLRKSTIGFLNPNESENGFCISVDRSIQDLWDHGASKEPKNPVPESGLFISFDATMIPEILD